ncbi:hypothetical protein Save01_08358 [Streptomyces avermitilis]
MDVQDVQDVQTGGARTAAWLRVIRSGTAAGGVAEGRGGHACHAAEYECGAAEGNGVLVHVSAVAEGPPGHTLCGADREYSFSGLEPGDGCDQRPLLQPSFGQVGDDVARTPQVLVEPGPPRPLLDAGGRSIGVHVLSVLCRLTCHQLRACYGHFAEARVPSRGRPNCGSAGRVRAVEASVDGVGVSLCGGGAAVRRPPRGGGVSDTGGFGFVEAAALSQAAECGPLSAKGGPEPGRTEPIQARHHTLPRRCARLSTPPRRSPRPRTPCHRRCASRPRARCRPPGAHRDPQPGGCHRRRHGHRQRAVVDRVPGHVRLPGDLLPSARAGRPAMPDDCVPHAQAPGSGNGRSSSGDRVHSPCRSRMVISLRLRFSSARRSATYAVNSSSVPSDRWQERTSSNSLAICS